MTLKMHDEAPGEIPFDIYPRQQLKRDSYMCLNGSWDYCERREWEPEVWSEKITVPYPPESGASGIGRVREKGKLCCYRRLFTIPEGFNRGRVLLNFGACDCETEVMINGKAAGEHKGGYLPFSLNISGLLQDGVNEIYVCVKDNLDHSYPWGKQKYRRGGMWYTPVSGIWQTVWLESVPQAYISAVRFTPSLEGVTARISGGEGEIRIFTPAGEIVSPIGEGPRFIKIPQPRLWSPEDPYLYRAAITLGEDKIETYFALRTVSIGERGGKKRILLNGEPVFFHGLLDQGYFPEGIYLPTRPEDYEEEILKLKKLGYNTLRKHIKIEPELYYYYCDKHGMLLWQDMVNNGEYHFLRDTALPTVGVQNISVGRFAARKEKKRREIFETHMLDTVSALYNHPSICLWTVFNEGWGQFDPEKMYARLRGADDTRLIDTCSGWFKPGKTDVDSYHVYFKPVKLTAGERPLVLSEFGGYALKTPGHVFTEKGSYGYRSFKDGDALNAAVKKLYEDEIIPLAKDGLCAAIYTQVSDVEDEINGVFTYDRRVTKLTPETMLPIAAALKAATE